jgi:hypothetical protein
MISASYRVTGTLGMIICTSFAKMELFNQHIGMRLGIENFSCSHVARENVARENELC